jgi:hypothetical protein
MPPREPIDTAVAGASRCGSLSTFRLEDGETLLDQEGMTVMRRSTRRDMWLRGLTWASIPYPISAKARISPAAANIDSDSVVRAALDATGGSGQYTGKIKSIPEACLALSAAGRQVLAYFCDGTDTHPASLSRWLHGENANGSVRLEANRTLLVAQLQGPRATGSVTLPDGSQHPFTAHVRYPDDGNSGWQLLRSEALFSGARYVGGWIVRPDRQAESLPPGPRVHPVSWFPPPAGSAAPIDRAEFFDDVDDDFPHTGGGIVNLTTGAVLPYAAPNLSTMTAEVPGLGTFHLHRCAQAKCG